MAKINQGMDVGHVAHLACIDLTAVETELFQGQLDQVLHYIEQLNELDVSGVEPMIHPIAFDNVFRKDEPGESLPHNEVIANAPSASDGQFRVPKIIDQ